MSPSSQEYDDRSTTMRQSTHSPPSYSPAPLYIIRRESADGLEVDVFTNEALATEWAALIGVDVTTEHPIDRTILNAMKESYMETAPDTEEESTPS